jgi:hypothetical protein
MEYIDNYQRKTEKVQTKEVSAQQKNGEQTVAK